MPWFKLTGDERITMRCATDGCGGQVTERLEADGYGSNYCSGCRAKIEAQDVPKLIWITDPANGVLRQATYDPQK